MLLSPPTSSASSRYDFRSPGSPPSPSSATSAQPSSSPRSLLHVATNRSFSDLHDAASMSFASLTASPTTFGPPSASPFVSSNSKTAAFFASPFSDPPVIPTTPSSSKSKTDAFFSTSFSALPTPLPSTSFASSSRLEPSPSDLASGKPTPPPLTRSRTADFFSSPSPRPTPHPSPLSVTYSLPPPSADAPAPPAPTTSLTTSFFSAPHESKPTPPPSLRSVSSFASFASSTFPSPTESSLSSHDPQERKARLPPLARLFPSRYNSLARSDESEPEFTSSPSPRVRDFVDLDAEGARSPRATMTDVASPPSAAVPPSGATAPESETHVHVAPSNAFGTGSIVRPAPGDPCAGLEYELLQLIGHGAFSRVWKARDLSKRKSTDKDADKGGAGELVAVKMVARGVGSSARNREKDRMRASFVREVEVLMRLSTPVPHPSIPTIVSSFTVQTHHVLVLPLIPGGELLSVINSDEQHARMTEDFVKRVWTELAGAVQWMHTKNVVHRDIKLENILLTSNPLASPSAALPPPGTPLVKLTDFGLARIIDPADPWLVTRCGSESYAAPELILAGTVSTSSDFLDEEQEQEQDEGGPGPAWEAWLSRAPSDATTAHSGSSRATAVCESAPVARAVTPRREGAYDGRETDAWALGVVLYALVTRRLPFEPPDAGRDALRKKDRRNWLMRIARGEWAWPEDAELFRVLPESIPVSNAGEGEETDAPPSPVEAEGGHDVDEADVQSVASVEDEHVGPPAVRMCMCGTGLALLPHVRRTVERLLVRNPAKRASVADVAAAWES